MPVNCDPPEHKRQRRLVTASFSPKSVEKMVPAIIEFAEPLTDEVVAKGAVDFVQEFTFPMPMTIIASILGVPTSRMEGPTEWTIALTQYVGSFNLTREQIINLFQRVNDFYDYFDGQIDDRIANPSDDLLTDLIASRIDGDRPLTRDELLQMLVQFLVAGNETTTTLIGTCLLTLTQKPELFAQLKQDYSLIPNFIEEMLRIEAPTQGMFRTVNEDYTLGGVEITARSMAYMIYAAANRDPAVFACPAEISDANEKSRHLSFGRGEHFCLSMHLARREGVISLELLLNRIATMVPQGELSDIEYHPSFMLRGIASLPVLLTAET